MKSSGRYILKLVKCIRGVTENCGVIKLYLFKSNTLYVISTFFGRSIAYKKHLSNKSSVHNFSQNFHDRKFVKPKILNLTHNLCVVYFSQRKMQEKFEKFFTLYNLKKKSISLWKTKIGMFKSFALSSYTLKVLQISKCQKCRILWPYLRKRCTLDAWLL